MAKVMQLRNQLQTTRKGGESVTDFVLKIKNIGDELLAAGDDIKEKDLIMSVLNGIGHEFDSVVVLISSQLETVSLENTQYQLMLHEQRITQLNSNTKSGFLSNADLTELHTPRKRGGERFGSRGLRGRGRGNMAHLFSSTDQGPYFEGEVPDTNSNQGSQDTKNHADYSYNSAYIASP
ncbi:hypothetical protein K2173_021558 [Erythroxylum novogranatense]|uniref:Uncharacterized protein n=1 Tax=Erythroxylum novogranatense TaxID=1862640 RepID=A0AAV8TQY9_9ROSI|nr:hypothetical protein K2173_021558 [Erythroxylum novogranatense]